MLGRRNGALRLARLHTVATWRHSRSVFEKPAEVRRIVETPGVSDVADLPMRLRLVSQCRLALRNPPAEQQPPKRRIFSVKKLVGVAHRNASGVRKILARHVAVRKVGIDYGLEPKQGSKPPGRLHRASTFAFRQSDGDEINHLQRDLRLSAGTQLRGLSAQTLYESRKKLSKATRAINPTRGRLLNFPEAGFAISTTQLKQKLMGVERAGHVGLQAIIDERKITIGKGDIPAVLTEPRASYQLQTKKHAVVRLGDLPTRPPSGNAIMADRGKRAPRESFRMNFALKSGAISRPAFVRRRRSTGDLMPVIKTVAGVQLRCGNQLRI